MALYKPSKFDPTKKYRGWCLPEAVSVDETVALRNAVL